LLQSELGLHYRQFSQYTRSTRKQSQSEQNKSAITNHVNTENHIINWKEATIIGWECDRTTRWIREAVKIRQEGQDVTKRQRGPSCYPTSTTTYYSPRLQLQ